jgi:hypothetical protein
MHLFTPASAYRYFRHLVGFPSPRLGAASLLLAVMALLASPAGAQPAELDIGVRSSVTEGNPKWNKARTEAAGGHNMIYGILGIKQVDNVDRLVRPVDEKKVVSILMDTLDENGFREFLPGETPAILITASYGRGEMANPYIRDTGAVGGAASSPSGISRSMSTKDSSASPDGLNLGANGMLPSYPGSVGQTGASGQGPSSQDSAPLTQTITGASPMQLFDEKTPGYEAKLQKAGYEKLFIRITAWEYPPTPKSKPKMLWKTIMVVDDPDHRDLNKVASAMLAAGGPWFDKLHRKPEVEVRKPLPEGRVNVGVPEVKEPAKDEKRK